VHTTGAYDHPVETWIQTELDSGERVISERLPHVRSATIGYWIGTGSRDETESKAGVSHFIEHLLFKGSSRFSALEIAEIFDGMGGELNAATSREHTVVYGRVPENHIETALDVMGDMVFSPFFHDLDAEREVVLEEIAMYEDTPQELVHDLIGEAVFGSHALGRPVIGTADVISSVTRRTLRNHHAAFYSPANIVVAAAGSIDHDHLVELVQASIERRAQAVPAKPRIRSPLLKTPKPGLRFQRKDTEQYHVCLGAPGVSRSDRRRFAASILDAILGGSASSRLFQEIREKRGMAYAVYSFLSQYADTGQIGIYVGTREDNLAEALQITTEQVADIAAGNLRPGELSRAQENLKGRLLLSMESTSARMTRLGKSLVTDSEILSLDRLVAEVDGVDTDAVCGLAAELLAPARLSAAGIGPSEERFLAALEHATPALARAA
jgi:predicted Zn-dependent peptidase